MEWLKYAGFNKKILSTQDFRSYRRMVKYQNGRKLIRFAKNMEPERCKFKQQPSLAVYLQYT